MSDERKCLECGKPCPPDKWYCCSNCRYVFDQRPPSHTRCGRCEAGKCSALVWEDGTVNDCPFSGNSFRCPVEIALERAAEEAIRRYQEASQ